ncbi:unnamed protein product [Paramecium primaurelia]|uniref:RING-type domain-containing protein n=1 Tax=Paramecium primaurelia TaxID=5886 RepID=A0A8S1MFJ4_PARPR|nr:unnamed protein product [Paramecium primaurelia]
MSTHINQTQQNLTNSQQETNLRNRIRSRKLFITTIIKFFFAILLFLLLSLQIQYYLDIIYIFVLFILYYLIDFLNLFYYNFQMKKLQIRFKKKKLLVYLGTTILDFIYLTQLLMLIKMGYKYFVYSNVFLVIAILMNFHSLYSDRALLESLKMLNKISLLIRIYILICSLFITLKIDNIIIWNWTPTLWSVWVGLICFIGISAGSLIVSFSKIIQYMFDRQNLQKSELISNIWITQFLIFGSVSLALSSLGYLEYLENQPNYTHNFIIQQYFIIVEFFIIIIYSIYFRIDICEQIFITLQDDEPINQQQFSVNMQGNNQTMQQINPTSSRTQIPQVVQKISKTYFGIPTRIKKEGDQDSISASPVLKKSSKGHKRAFSSQGVASQMFQELDQIVIDKQSSNTLNKTTSNELRCQIDKKRCNSHLVTIAHDESVQNKNQELSMSQTSNICLVCYERGPNAVFMNCGHGGTCYQCAIDIWKQKMVCYLCRNKIEYILKVDLEDRYGDLFKVVSTAQMIDQFNK